MFQAARLRLILMATLPVFPVYTGSERIDGGSPSWQRGYGFASDCFGMLDDHGICRYFELGCEVKSLGRGHVKRIKDEAKQREQ